MLLVLGLADLGHFVGPEDQLPPPRRSGSTTRGRVVVKAWELEAREAIRDLVARYNAQGDAGHIEAMLELFCEDACLEVEGRIHRGRGAIGTLFSSAAAGTRAGPTRFLQHLTATHQIDLRDRGSAVGRSYFLVLTEAGLDHWGRYLDEYVLDGDGWQFAKRVVRVDGMAPGGWADEWLELIS